jgi:hypothetical protein
MGFEYTYIHFHIDHNLVIADAANADAVISTLLMGLLVAGDQLLQLGGVAKVVLHLHVMAWLTG